MDEAECVIYVKDGGELAESIFHYLADHGLAVILRGDGVLFVAKDAAFKKLCVEELMR